MYSRNSCDTLIDSDCSALAEVKKSVIFASPASSVSTAVASCSSPSVPVHILHILTKYTQIVGLSHSEDISSLSDIEAVERKHRLDLQELLSDVIKRRKYPGEIQSESMSSLKHSAYELAG